MRLNSFKILLKYSKVIYPRTLVPFNTLSLVKTVSQIVGRKTAFFTVNNIEVIQCFILSLKRLDIVLSLFRMSSCTYHGEHKIRCIITQKYIVFSVNQHVLLQLFHVNNESPDHIFVACKGESNRRNNDVALVTITNYTGKATCNIAHTSCKTQATLVRLQHNKS